MKHSRDVTKKSRWHKDITGKKMGKLTAIRYLGKRKWICQCDCGNIKTVETAFFNAGHVKSCGCLHKEVMSKNTLPNALSSFNKLYYMYKSKSKKRGHGFFLSRNDFRKLTKLNCFYCGIEPMQEYKMRKNSSPYIYNGIDRINSDGDYILNNCVTCCHTCNYAKRMMSVDDFKKWIRRVYVNFIEGQINELV
jgi:hypothetical protein